MVQAHRINLGITITPYGEPFLAQEKKHRGRDSPKRRLIPQTFVGKDAVHCRGGCSALRERLQCTASEIGKRGTEIASPILDEEMEGNDALIR